MKLRQISENVLSAGTPIRDLGEVFGTVIDVIYHRPEFKDSIASTVFKKFLSKPSAKEWSKIKDNFLKNFVAVINQHPDLKDSNEKLIDDLSYINKNVDDIIVMASLLDMDPNHTNETPLRALSMGKMKRDKAKQALGPTGFIGYAATLDTIPPEKIKQTWNKFGDNGRNVARVVKKMYPNAKPLEKF